ncbi:MAG: 1,4-alpha-glucan branching protein GlgB, partial [Actinomycetes bacterium]
RSTMRADPFARAAEVPPATASVLVRSTYEWSAASAPSLRVDRNAGRHAVYEAHLGSWRRHPDGRPHTARELAAPFADWVAGLGFTHVELLPVMTHPFGGSWGYQVSGYFAPDARLGSPDDLLYLIDTCHERGLGVLLDWVPAHFPRDEFALGRFDGTALYEHDDPKRGAHPDWGTLVFNHGRNEVRNFLISNALYWLEEFRADGLRVDAVASMLYRDYSRGPGEWVPNEFGGREDLDAVGFVRELTEVVADECPGALVVAEESTAWAGVTAPLSSGGLGFSHKWNLGWMHDTLGYFHRDPVHRAHHHGELTFPMVYAADERWVLPLSHDEVVHGKGSLLGKMPGDSWQQFANLRAVLAWQWSHPGRQLLFMGGELAQPTEWSHDAELPWFLLEDPRHDGVRQLVVDLNALQSAHPALWAGDDDPYATTWWLDADDRTHSVFAWCRRDPSGEDIVAVVANLTPVPRHGYRLGVPAGAADGEPAAWRVLLSTDDARFGGSDHAVLLPDHQHVVADTATPWQGQPASLLVSLPPLAVVALGPVSS